MNRILAAALVLGGMAIAATPVLAQQATGSVKPSPSAQPAAPAKTKSISRSEYLDFAAKRFDRMDLNHDGVLSPEERAAARRQQSARSRSTTAPGQTVPAAPRQPG
ncbi:MAG: hypothetical protein HY246_26740 [Proteobacteria bacterium]|nr:hypothetical protein [Pseudomonadota bacterium]